MVIIQGDVFWIELEAPLGSEPGCRHPHVVVQNNLFNGSRIRTVVVCALTSNLKRGMSPGNVILHEGEANLLKQCVVNVAQIFSVNRTDLVEKIGSLSKQRIQEILQGIQLVMTPRDAPD